MCQDWKYNENQEQLERDVLIKREIRKWKNKSNVTIPMNGSENQLTGSREKLLQWERLSKEPLFFIP